MNHAELAQKYFLEGYNCAQSVVLAFSDLTHIDEDQAVRLASSFGGGMGGLRQNCGAVSGILIVAGLLMGYDEPNNLEVKRAHYERVQALVNAFLDENGTMNCRELLTRAGVPVFPTPAERTPEYYARRPCPHLVASAAAILDRMLAEALPSEKDATKSRVHTSNS